MKCSMCGKRVPIGAKECPSCGHKINESHSQVTTSKNKKALLLFMLIVIGIVAYTLFVSEVMPIKHPPLDYITRLTYQETIDRGYDDGSVEVAKGIEKEVETFVRNELQLSNIEINEYCLSDGRTTTTCFDITGEFENVKYGFGYSVNNKKLSMTNISVSGTTNQSIKDMSQLPINEQLTNKMGDYLKISQVYTQFNQAKTKIKQNKDYPEKSFYSNKGHPEIDILEMKENEIKYDFTCDIYLDYNS